MTPSVLLAAANLLLGGLVFLLGLVILRENLRQRLNRIVAFMLFFGGLGSILAALDFLAPRDVSGADEGFFPAFSQNFSYLWEFFFPTLLLFACLFPRERWIARKFRSFEFLVYLPHAVHFLLLLGISMAGPGVSMIENAPGWARPAAGMVDVAFGLFLAIHTALFSLVNLGYGVASAALLLQSYRRARAPRLRQQLRVMGTGLILGLILYSFSSLIPPLLNVGIDPSFRALLTVAALTLISGGIAYSVVRYKFLDIKLLARRGILYGLASAVLVGVYLLVVEQFNRLFAGFLGGNARLVEPVLLIIALILFQPAMVRLEEILERLFLRDPTDYRNVLRKLGHDVLTEIDLDALLSRSIGTVAEALLLRHAYVAAFARDGTIIHKGAGEEIDKEDGTPLRPLTTRVPPEREGLRVRDPDAFSMEDAAYLTRVFRAEVLVPLRSKGETVGALVLGSKVTGTDYTSEDVALLSELATRMAVSLQNSLLLLERVAAARLEEEANLARAVQTRFLPSSFPDLGRIEVYGVNSPSREVGGDFYDLVPDGNGAHFLAIADVSGKGMGAALLTSMLQASLRTQAGSAESVSAVLQNLNTLLSRSTPPDQFVTFFLARIETESLGVTFSNAGHNYPFLCRRNGDRVFLEKGGTVLGMFEGLCFDEDRISLEPGDRMVLYTDGITEAVNGDDEEYGEERLRELARNLPPELGARHSVERILDDLKEFLGGAEAQDDVTLIVLRVRESATPVPEPDPEPVTADAR